MSEVDLLVKEVQERHFELVNTPGKCACSLPWPCGSIQKTLADEVERLRKRDKESKRRAEARRQEIKRTRKGFRKCEAKRDRLREALERTEPPQDTVRLLPARPTVVTLCGSTRFMDAFFEVGWQLTLQGKIVLSVGVCKHAEDHGGEALGGDVCERLDELHWRKIDLSDEVMVLNVGGYIGESTQAEIEYAERVGKRVLFLEDRARAALNPGDADGEQEERDG